MKKLLACLLIGLGAAPLWAQSTATTGALDFEAERARLAQERTAIEERFATEQAACYQKFAVEGCLEESRRRRRAGIENVKRQEAAMNDIERKRRGAAQLDRLEQ
jgi:colicin import membrane protein